VQLEFTKPEVASRCAHYTGKPRNSEFFCGLLVIAAECLLAPRARFLNRGAGPANQKIQGKKIALPAVLQSQTF